LLVLVLVPVLLVLILLKTELVIFDPLPLQSRTNNSPRICFSRVRGS
jgi:hypothetical protein